MSSTTTNGQLPLLSSLMDPSFGIPPDVTFQIMGSINVNDHQQSGCQDEETLLGEVKGHKMLLGLFSPVFKKEFFGPAKETKDVIPVRQTSLESFETMFDYIYSKTIEWKGVSVLEMYDVVNLAEKYHIPDLLDAVKSQMENVPLTMGNVMEVANTAIEFTQFPSISASLLQSCAKFLKSTLKSDGQLLQFAICHSGSGKEATALQLLSLAKELTGTGTIVCSNCGEETCQDKLNATELKKISAGCKLTLSTTNVNNSWYGKKVVVVSAVAKSVRVISPISKLEEDYNLKNCGQYQFKYMCT